MNAARWVVIGLLAVSILILSFAFGYVARGDGGSKQAAAPTPAAGATQPADTITADTDFKNLNDIYKILQSKYVDPDLVDRQTLYQAAITGLLQTFPDSGTFYVDPNTVKTSVGPSGKFDGIGATFQVFYLTPDGQAAVGGVMWDSAGHNITRSQVAPIEGTPAERAGLKAGDAILEVNGESTAGWTQEKAVLKIRGPRGTVVKLKVRSDKEERTLDIERDEIKVQSVTTQPPGGALKDGAGANIDDLAYIHIREFDEPTKDEMQTALKDAVSSGKKGIVLDLRNNPGGLLRTTADIADEFLDGDKTILTERERDGSEQKFPSHSGGAATEIPVVIISAVQAVGTSLLVIVFLAIPTLATHWALGHIDWAISLWLALGLVPASFVASRYAHKVEGPTLRRWFGVFLIVLGAGYTVYRLVAP